MVSLRRRDLYGRLGRIEQVATIQTIRDLRHRWTPHQERLPLVKGEQATAIRIGKSATKTSVGVPGRLWSTIGE